MKELLKNHIPQPIGDLSSYAVLIPLIKMDEKWHILYQVRGQAISQPGEVSFPGGRLEEGEGFQEAAIRETCEELGISCEQIDLLGELDYLVQPGRIIHSFVGILEIEDLRHLTPNPSEVDRLFTVPLDQLLNSEPTYHSLAFEIKQGQEFPFDKIPNGAHYRFTDYLRKIPFYDIEGEVIWGITALFTHSLTALLAGKKTP